MTKEQITNKAKKLGWNVEFSRDKHKRVTFENWTPYGQDIILEYEYKNLDEIREQLKVSMYPMKRIYGLMKTDTEKTAVHTK